MTPTPPPPPPSTGRILRAVTGYAIVGVVVGWLLNALFWSLLDPPDPVGGAGAIVGMLAAIPIGGLAGALFGLHRGRRPRPPMAEITDRRPNRTISW